jgi:hypothetical protein
VDDKGRTRLMEASLWCHARLVDVLVKAGADRSMRDLFGMTAADLADESERNDEERHKQHIKYSEDPFIKKRHRRLIRCLLKHKQSAISTKTALVHDLIDAYFYKSVNANTISFVIPTTGIGIATQQKTAAFLHRGSPFPVVAAVSGWSGPGYREFFDPEAGFERLDAAYWMPRVLRLAKAIGFTFESHSCDTWDAPGSYNAGHADPQLMCFFIERNYIFRDYDEGDNVQDDFLQIFLLQERNHQAQVIVSKSPCYSCNAFVRWVSTKDRVRLQNDRG